jgi:ABC-type glucose/galactose transport system permease subunit
LEGSLRSRLVGGLSFAGVLGGITGALETVLVLDGLVTLPTLHHEALHLAGVVINFFE